MLLLSETCQDILSNLEKYINKPSPSAYRDALRGIDQLMAGILVPPSQIAALKNNLLYCAENGGDETVPRGLAYALACEIAAIMGLYCNEEFTAPSRVLPRRGQARCTCVLLCDENFPGTDSVLTVVPDEMRRSLEVFVIGVGARPRTLEFENQKAAVYVFLPEPLGYAQIFRMFSCMCSGEIIIFSDNGALPGEKALTQMLKQCKGGGRYFYTAAEADAGEVAGTQAPYFDPCPSWGFQMFSGSLFEAGVLPDMLLGSMELLRQAFAERTRDAGISVLTFADQTAIYPESALLRDFHADNFNRWRFIQIMGHEPFRVSDTVLIAKALAFFSVPAKTLIVAERQTTLYLALLRQSEASGAETEWVLYDGNEEHGIFVSRIVRALRPCEWERIIFCVPVNRFHDFESLIDIAAASANERGRIWYYDENLFFIDSVDVVLADGIFADRPNRCPLTLFFRKRLRDRLYALGFDLSFERYRPSLDDGGHELLNRLCAVFPDLRDAVMNNAATKLYFCVAAKRDGPKGENTV